MLETILEKSKKVIKKAKRPLIGFLAGLTLMYASGCATCTQKIKTEWVEISSREIIEEKIAKEEKVKEYKINDAHLENSNLQIFITENLNKKIFNATKTNIISLYKEFDIICKNLLCSTNYHLKKSISDSRRTYENGHNSWYIREWIIKNPGKFKGHVFLKHLIEVKAEPTGNTKEKITEGEWKIIKIPKTEIIYSDKPSQNTRVKIINEKLRLYLNNFTDTQGKIIFKIDTPKNWDTNKENLISKIKNYGLVQDTKEPFKTKLLPSIENLIKRNSEELYIETKEINSKETSVINDRKTISISGFSIKENYIYSILEDFINQEINSRIKETTIIVQDSNSHVEIPNVKLEMEVKAPNKRDLADNYFTGNLLEWAITQIEDYKKGNFSQYTNKQGTITFNVYAPSTFKFETKHSKYHAFEKSTSFSNHNLSKTIRLIDIGQKLRVEKEEKRGGDLIEK